MFVHTDRINLIGSRTRRVRAFMNVCHHSFFGMWKDEEGEEEFEEDAEEEEGNESKDVVGGTKVEEKKMLEIINLVVNKGNNQ